MPQTPRATWLPYAAAGVTLVLWASAFVAIRHLGHDFSPGALALGRQVVAALVLGVVVMARGFTRPQARDLPGLVLIGVLWFALYHVALNEAERRVDAGTASMLLQVSPIIIAVLAAVFLHEPATRALAVGMVVAFGGVVLIALAGSDGGHNDVVGVLLCLVAAAAYCISVILQKPMLTRLPALELTWLACTIGAVACLPFAGSLTADARAAPWESVAWLVYLGVLPTAVAFTTWAYALTHLAANTMGVSTYLVPPITIVIAWLLLGETPPRLAYVGGVLALFGVWLSKRPQRAEVKPQEVAAS